MRLRDLAQQSVGHAAEVYLGGESREDEKQRKTLEVPMEVKRRSELDKKIEALRPELGRHFGFTLDGGVEPPRCLVYRPGDFFELHTDTASVESERFHHIGHRRLSMVIFLNEPNDPSEPYEGGTLIFHELMEFEGSRAFGFPVDTETGLLMVFPSSRLHQVSPVTRGRRFSIVAWFLQ